MRIYLERISYLQVTNLIDNDIIFINQVLVFAQERGWIMSVKFFTITHKKYNEPIVNGYESIQVGAANKEQLGYLRDDSGDNISEKNANYCELTGLYWIWKNCDYEGNIGICHYRRYFVHEDGSLLAPSEADRILESKDIILLQQQKLENFSSVLEHYATRHHICDMQITRDVIGEKYPEYLPEFDELMKQPEMSCCNMMISSRRIFNDYCQWLFDILFEVERRVDISTYDNYQKRIFGFISERLLNVFVAHNQFDVEYLMMGEIANEAKTTAIKNKCYELIKNGKHQDAITTLGDGIKELDQERPSIFDIEGTFLNAFLFEYLIQGENTFGHTRLSERFDDFNSIMYMACAAKEVLIATSSASCNERIIRVAEEKGVDAGDIFSLSFMVRDTNSRIKLLTDIGMAYANCGINNKALGCIDYALMFDNTNKYASERRALLLEKIK